MTVSMTSAELRASFVRFFEKLGHVHVPSASLVPDKMSTTLFTIAGMEPFVPVFLGEEPATAKRVVSVQRCLRVAGAKSDIENVGRTGRHGTFLEMLGNFAFADYGKRDVIAWAWEYLTKTLALDPERLYITVHINDDEADMLWREIGIPAARISRFDEDNFWTMGPTGPCGPSTEIFYDNGPAYATSDGDTGPNLGGRYVEIWNLVFQQFNREADGTLRPLAALNIDTGAGLERVLAVVNGKVSMYETDLFVDLVDAQPPVGETNLDAAEQLVRQRIIADHARAVTALIADGVHPSNNDRGYVLRFLIRRAIRNGRLLGYPDGFLTGLVPAVVTSLGSGFPELIGAGDRVATVLGREEAAFVRTLERGEQMLTRKLSELRASGKHELSGSDAFTLHDTFGFPIELTREIAGEAEIAVDGAGFEREMEAQRHRARSDAASKRGVVSVAGDRSHLQTEFLGYGGLVGEGDVLEILREDGTPVDEAIAGERVRIVLDRSSFYAEKGGQIGDHGILRGGEALCVVDDTQMIGDAIAHHALVDRGIVRRGQRLETLVDESWREEIRRHHTSAHLLQYALREVLGADIAQAGSWVGPERMRFDFRSPAGALTAEQRAAVSATVNRVIRDDHHVETVEVPIEEARELGAISMAGENYGSFVRVLRAGPSLEFCGGTHAHSTGELGMFVMLSEGSVGSGVRRIEGVVSRAAEQFIARQQEIISELSSSLTVAPEELVERVERLRREARERDREIAEYRAKAASEIARNYASEAVVQDGRRIVVAHIADTNAESLRELATAVRGRLDDSAVVALVGTDADAASIMVIAGAAAVASGVHAGNLVKAAVVELDGRGGGSAPQAQGGGKKLAGVEKAIGVLRSMLSI